jgi:NAD-dependent glutamate dehydrogenase
LSSYAVTAHGHLNTGQAGDRANDSLRVDADTLRAKVVGEGANLPMTQRARIEYALAGGRLNTDAVDNSAGVDTSDHEVNIKIGVRHRSQPGEGSHLRQRLGQGQSASRRLAFGERASLVDHQRVTFSMRSSASAVLMRTPACGPRSTLTVTRHSPFCRRLVDGTVRGLGGLDIVVNNAARQQTRIDLQRGRARADLALQVKPADLISLIETAFDCTGADGARWMRTPAAATCGSSRLHGPHSMAVGRK